MNDSLCSSLFHFLLEREAWAKLQQESQEQNLGSGLGGGGDALCDTHLPQW